MLVLQLGHVLPAELREEEPDERDPFALYPPFSLESYQLERVECVRLPPPLRKDQLECVRGLLERGFPVDYCGRKELGTKEYFTFSPSGAEGLVGWG